MSRGNHRDTIMVELAKQHIKGAHYGKHFPACVECKCDRIGRALTEAEIKALNGTPGPAMLSKMFPMGRR